MYSLIKEWEEKHQHESVSIFFIGRKGSFFVVKLFWNIFLKYAIIFDAIDYAYDNIWSIRTSLSNAVCLAACLTCLSASFMRPNFFGFQSAIHSFLVFWNVYRDMHILGLRIVWTVLFAVTYWTLVYVSSISIITLELFSLLFSRDELDLDYMYSFYSLAYSSVTSTSFPFFPSRIKLWTIVYLTS